LVVRGSDGKDVVVTVTLDISPASFVTNPKPPPPPVRPRKQAKDYYGAHAGIRTWEGTLAPNEELRLDATATEVLSAPIGGKGILSGDEIPYEELSSLSASADDHPEVTVDLQENQVVVRNTGSVPVTRIRIRWKMR
jgi:hypothetical protein